MANDIPNFELLSPKRNGLAAVESALPAPIADAPPDEADIDAFKASVLAKLTLAIGKDGGAATPRDWFVATALALRDRVIHRWLAVNRASHAEGRKRVYYLSLEFLIGRLFADVVDFTPMAANMTPLELVDLLNEVFQCFDNLVDKYAHDNQGDDQECQEFLGLLRRDREQGLRIDATKGLKQRLSDISSKVFSKSKKIAIIPRDSSQDVLRLGELGLIIWSATSQDNALRVTK